MAGRSSYPAITLTVNVSNSAAASITNTVAVSGGGYFKAEDDIRSHCVTGVQTCALPISKSHTGNFAQGQAGATYTITVNNSGSGATSGTVTVTDTLPSGLTATAIAGTGLSCFLGTPTCHRQGSLAAELRAPTITLPVTFRY